MPQLKSSITAAIGRDAGAPSKTSPDEQCSGTGLDDVDRGDFPEIEDITSNLTPASGKSPNSGLKRKSGQLGTT